MTVRFTAALLTALFALAPGFAWAEDDESELSGQARVEAAEAAYDEGVQAFEAEFFTTAGAAFERADALLPARVAMENAIRAYRRGGDARRAATVARALVERDVSARAQARFVPEVAASSFEVTVSCDAPCTITVDGEEERYRTFFLAPETPHFFRARFASGVRETASSGDAGEERTLIFEVPDASNANDGSTGPGPLESRTPDGENDDAGMGVLPAWATLGAAAATLGLAAATIWSGIDTGNARTAFDISPSLEGLEAGQSKEGRTNILLGVTIGMAVVTAAMAVFTDWSFAGDEESDGAVHFGAGPIRGGVYASLSGSME